MQKTRSPNIYDTQTAILSNEEVAEAHYLLRCECPEIARRAQPGQFVHVMISPGTGLLLRRPFTIYTVEGTQITMLYQIIGEGTERLSEMPIGASLQILGPLGTPFDIASKAEPAILVGGGAGIASLMLLAVALRERGIPTLGLVGAQHRARLLSVADLEGIGIGVHIATDDGSVGHHGFVTDILRELLGKTDWQYPQIYAVARTECSPLLQDSPPILRCRRKSRWKIGWAARWGCALGVSVLFGLRQNVLNISVFAPKALFLMQAILCGSYRSAGACPPRSFGGPQHGEGQALALQFPRRSPPIVARGPVPRDRSICARHGEGQALALRLGKDSVLREDCEGQAPAPVPRKRK